MSALTHNPGPAHTLNFYCNSGQCNATCPHVVYKAKLARAQEEIRCANESYVSAFQELLLENAGANRHRTVPGCAFAPASPVPAPRLVGIETNPGPTPPRRSVLPPRAAVPGGLKNVARRARAARNRGRGPRQQSEYAEENRARALNISPSVYVPSAPRATTLVAAFPGRGGRPFRGRKGRNYASRQPLNSYIQSVADPFRFYPPPVAAGTMVPLARRTLWVKAVSTPLTSSLYFMIFSMPSSGTIISVYHSVTALGPWVFIGSQSAANTAGFNGSVDYARCISGGMSCKINYTAGTTLPPTCYVGRYFTSPSSIAATNPTVLLSTGNLVQVSCPTTLIGGYSTSRPADNRSFELSTEYLSNAASGGVIATGINVFMMTVPVQATTVEVNCVYHMETNSGTDASTADNDQDDTDIGAVQGDENQLGRAALSLGPSSSGPITDLVSHVIDNEVARNAARSSQFSLNTEGGLIPTDYVAMPNARSLSTSTSAPPPRRLGYFST